MLKTSILPHRRDAKPRTKIAVRSLPHNLTEDAFKESIARFLQDIDYLAYFQGRQTSKREINSRAFVNFTTPEALQYFVEHYAGHTFIDSKGNEKRAEIEYALSQQVPPHAGGTTSTRAQSRRNLRLDPNAGTIETDGDYLRFLEDQSKKIELLPSAEIQLEQRLALEASGTSPSASAMPRTTPLLEALKAKKIAKFNAKKARAAKRAARAAASHAERRRRKKDKAAAGTGAGVPADGAGKKLGKKRGERGSRRGGRNRTNKKKEKAGTIGNTPPQPATAANAPAASPAKPQNRAKSGGRGGGGGRRRGSAKKSQEGGKPTPPPPSATS